MEGLNVEAAMENVKFTELIPEIPEFNAKYFSQNHPKTKEAKDKVRRLHQEELEFRKKV